MSKYNQFIFKNYSFNKASGQISFQYSYDNILDFTENINLEIPNNEYNEKALDIALRHLFIMAGVSYYKAYLSPDIIVEPFSLSQQEADFYENIYQNGLREFFYTNRLPVDTPVKFQAEDVSTASSSYQGDGGLVGLGGGKDSLVGLEIAKNDYQPISTWSVGGPNYHNKIAPIVTKTGTNHIYVTRIIDNTLLQLNDLDALNGHIPVSAIYACLGSVLCILNNMNTTIVSNESSADEASVIINGLPVNHQFSKTSIFESNYEQLLNTSFNNGLHYKSIIRHLNETQVAEMFVKSGLFEKYNDVFYSCNRAFIEKNAGPYWCGTCAKCCFVFLILTPLVEKTKLESVFKSNPLLNDKNQQHYLELLGKSSQKPLDCIGTISESKNAMTKALNIYPELNNIYGD